MLISVKKTDFRLKKEKKMNKRLSLYQIFMVAMTTIIAAMLVAMGVIAIQKSMRLKLAFQINPAIEIMLEMAEIDEEGEVGEFRSIFQNSNTPFIENGITLSGNTLSFGNAYAEGLGANFALKITNLTESMVLAGFSGASYDKPYLIFEPRGSEAQQVTVSAVSALTIDFTQIVAVSITDNSNGGLTLSTTDESDLIKVNGSYLQNNGVYYAELGKEISLYYELGSSYKNNSISASVGGQQVASGSTSITISATNAMSNITITLQAELSGYTVTFNTTNWSVSYTNGDAVINNEVLVNSDSSLNVVLKGIGDKANHSIHEVSGLPADSTFNRYTGILTLSNLQSNATISVTEFRPWTYGIYPDDHAWAGYKYITFANNSQYKSNFNNGAYDMNWIIIGAGELVNSAIFTGVTRPENYNPERESEELGDNEILLFSENVLAELAWSSARYVFEWSKCSLRDYLNNSGNANFLSLSGLSEYLTYIKSDNEITTYSSGADTVVTDQAIFILACSYQSALRGVEQSFEEVTYLGGVAGGYQTAFYASKYYTNFLGGTSNTWWLRSPHMYAVSASLYTAYKISTSGIATQSGGEVLMAEAGVRPCFVLNLA